MYAPCLSTSSFPRSYSNFACFEPVSSLFLHIGVSHTTLLCLPLQPSHIQACNVPAARLALTVQCQRAKMAKSLLAAFFSADEGVQQAVVHPLLYFTKLDATCADLGVDVEIHVERRVPPFTETEHQERWVLQIWAFSRFEVVEEAGIGAHYGIAAPTRNASGDMFRHVLLLRQHHVIQHP